MGYIGFLARAYGCVNNSPFKGFDVGEVRFLGGAIAFRKIIATIELTIRNTRPVMCRTE